MILYLIPQSKTNILVFASQSVGSKDVTFYVLFSVTKWRAFESLHLAPLEKSQAQAILPSNNLGYLTCIHTKNVGIPWIFNNDPKDCLEAQIE